MQNVQMYAKCANLCKMCSIVQNVPKYKLSKMYKIVQNVTECDKMAKRAKLCNFFAKCGKNVLNV